MFCSKCGARLTEGTTFCSVCGEPVGGPPIASGVPTSYAPPAIAPAGAVQAYPAAPMAVALPSPYAGFWLRVVAYIIDGIILGVIFGVLFLIGIAFVGIGSMETMARGMHNGDAEPPVALVLMLIFIFFLVNCCVVDILRVPGELTQSGDTGKNGAGINRDGFAGAADQLSAMQRDASSRK